MNAPLIREATLTDAAALAELLGELGYPTSAAELPGRLLEHQNGRSRVWVAEEDGVVVGFVSFHALPQFHASELLGRVTGLCVASTHRRRQLGLALLEVAEAFAREIHCTRMEVTSGEHRADEAHRFYEAGGYATKGRRFVRALGIP